MQLGAEIFKRSPGGVCLTEIGECFLTEARAAIERLDGAAGLVRELGAAEANRLRLGLSMSVIAGRVGTWLASALQGVKQLDLQITEAEPASLARSLQQQALDIGLMLAAPSAEDLCVRRLWREPLMLISPPDDKFVGQAGLSWRHLAGACLLVPGVPGGELEPTVRRGLEQAGAAADVRCQAVGVETVLRMVQWRQGLAVLPASAVPEGRADIAVTPLVADIELCAVWRRRNDKPALARLLRWIERSGAFS